MNTNKLNAITMCQLLHGCKMYVAVTTSTKLCLLAWRGDETTERNK